MFTSTQKLSHICHRESIKNRRKVVASCLTCSPKVLFLSISGKMLSSCSPPQLNALKYSPVSYKARVKHLQTLLNTFEHLNNSPFLRSVQNGARAEEQTVICPPCSLPPLVARWCWHLSDFEPTKRTKCSLDKDRYVCLGLSYGPHMQLVHAVSTELEDLRFISSHFDR